MKYTIRCSHPSSRQIHIETCVEFPSSGEKRVCLPVWRPGRYERADFAQYVSGFNIKDSAGNNVKFKKRNGSEWVLLSEHSSFTVSYSFYAGILNAGSTWVDESCIYINPVNCLLYKPDSLHEACELTLQVPKNYTIATSLSTSGFGEFKAADYHELADSPIIAAESFTHFNMLRSGVDFHFWFRGGNPDVPVIQPHMEKIIDEQLKTMADFPVKTYHVLCHILPYPAYHGVEHLASTVLTLGPASKFMEPELYMEYLGVFSHELFHVWNVKTIRPSDMQPYDYSRENYSELGYVYEGVTTYFGDVFCIRSGVYTWDFFSGILQEWLTRYNHNFGREVYSVAQSSFDTWLDGYKPGVAGRRVNIYNEGALCAWMADLLIRKSTNDQKSMNDVMKLMYERFGKTGLGYTRNDYKQMLEEIAGISFEVYFNRFIEGTSDYVLMLNDLVDHVGLKIIERNHPSVFASRFGFQVKIENGKQIVTQISPDSPAFQAGLALQDEIIGLNNGKIDESLIDLNNELTLQINRFLQSKVITLHSDDKKYYNLIFADKIPEATGQQKAAFENWLGVVF